MRNKIVVILSMSLVFIMLVLVKPYISYFISVNDLCDTLSYTHPNGSIVISSLSFHNKYFSDYSRIGSLNLNAQYLFLVNKFHDGHTYWDYLNYTYSYPGIVTSCYNNKLFIKDCEINKQLVGWEIVEICDRKTIDILNDLRNYISYDNEELFYDRIEKLILTDYFLDLIKIETKSFRITVTNGEEFRNLKLNFTDEYNPINLYDFDNKINIQNNQIILEINSLVYSEELVDMFYRFVKKYGQSEKIIIDLSGCTGGDSYSVAEFMKYFDIQQYKGFNNQIYDNESYSTQITGDVTVIVSKTTFSAGALLASVMKENDLAKIVGDNIGMNYNAYGNSEVVRVKQADFKLYVSRDEFCLPNFDKRDTLDIDLKLEDIYENYKGYDMIRNKFEVLEVTF